MDIGGWVLVAWIGAAMAALFFLIFCLTRICGLSCEDLSCVRNQACDKGDA